VNVRLADIAHARSGDKANRADIGLFAWDEVGYAILAAHVTRERVAVHFAHLLSAGPPTDAGALAARVARFDLPNLLALKFVLDGALDGGAAASLRSDNLGKTIGAQLLRMEIEIDDAAAATLPRLAGHVGGADDDSNVP
jgi:hypothetical protein